jgi:hypothetical protein
MVEDLLEKARRDLVGEGWSREQVEAALDYAERWAEGNAGVAAGGDGRLRETLIRNYLPRGIEQARQWLSRSRSRWTSEQP